MQLIPGTKIKNYVLEERIGRGASGEVWKASDGSKTAAIKFMNENLLRGAAAEKHRLRLQREVDTLTQLQHPNIPTLYDYDLDAERPYLAMRYVGGDTYDKMIANGQMLQISLQKRLDIARELGQALWTAHSKGIIHRDIKPANMTGIETPYLLDFSISLKAQDALMTMFQVGTAFYMDPVDPPDQLADIYSFALVIYEMLFGQHAIFGPEDRHAQMPEHTRFVAWERLEKGDWSKPSLISREDLPIDLRSADLKRMDDIFAKALGRRETRYTDVREFVEELRGAVLGISTIKAQPAVDVDREAVTVLDDDGAGSTAPAYTPPSRPQGQRAPDVQINAPLRKPNEDNFTILEVEGEKDDQHQSGLVGRLKGLGKRIFR